MFFYRPNCNSRVTVFDSIYDAELYKMPPNFNRENQEKMLLIQNSYIKRNEIDISDKTFSLPFK